MTSFPLLTLDLACFSFSSCSRHKIAYLGFSVLPNVDLYCSYLPLKTIFPAPHQIDSDILSPIFINLEVFICFNFPFKTTGIKQHSICQLVNVFSVLFSFILKYSWFLAFRHYFQKEYLIWFQSLQCYWQLSCFPTYDLFLNIFHMHLKRTVFFAVFFGVECSVNVC